MIDENWAILAIAGFWGWVFCTLAFIFKAFPRRQLFLPKAGAWWGGGVLVSFCVWLFGMLNA